MPGGSINPSDLHDEQVMALLRSGAHAALLSAYFGEALYQELSQLARLTAKQRRPRGPLVYVLPGIMGSRLSSVRRRQSSLIWLHPAAVTSGALSRLILPGPRSIRTAGIMLPGYLKLKLSLEVAGFRPVFHPFDWRCDLERLGRAFMQTIERSGASKVLVVAHSMGGLVARAALAHDRQRRIAKLVQLGTPNSGSFAPLQVMRAVYPTVRKLAALDTRHTAEDLARMVFRTLPGLYQMLPQPLFDPDAWPRDGLAPNTRLLLKARKLRQRQPPADARCLLICGTHQETTSAAALQDDSFEYSINRDGDGTVPTSLAAWPGAPTWYVQENHGALTNNDEVLATVADLLRTGTTRRLTDQAPAIDGNELRKVTDTELRKQATTKLRWESLSLDSRRRILEPVISPEFRSADA